MGGWHVGVNEAQLLWRPSPVINRANLGLGDAGRLTARHQRLCIGRRRAAIRTMKAVQHAGLADARAGSPVEAGGDTRQRH